MYKLFAQHINQALILEAWNNAQIVDGYDENFFRKEANGNWISWSDYGNTNSNLGWNLVLNKKSKPQAVQWSMLANPSSTTISLINQSRKIIATNYWM